MSYGLQQTNPRSLAYRFAYIDVKEMHDYYKHPHTIQETAAQFHISTESLSRLFKKYEFPIRKRGGGQGPRRELDQEEVSRLLAAGHGTKRIAEALGVSRPVVYRHLDMWGLKTIDGRVRTGLWSKPSSRLNNLFSFLFSRQKESGCQKKAVVAGTVIGGQVYYAANTCTFQGETCPRLSLPGGTDYHLCQSDHAEQRLARQLQALDLRIEGEGIVWVVGQYYACRDCALALKAVGMKELRVRENPR